MAKSKKDPKTPLTTAPIKELDETSIKIDETLRVVNTSKSKLELYFGRHIVVNPGDTFEVLPKFRNEISKLEELKIVCS